MNAYSMEENCASEELKGADLIVNVCDALTLVNSLNLTHRLISVGKPVVMYVTKSGQLKRRGGRIDKDKLSSYLGKLFHMPGHKGSGDFKSRFKDAPIDVTELTYTDNLLNPTGAIAKAQKDIAKICGAVKSYITTDGSSSGVLALAYWRVEEGEQAYRIPKLAPKRMERL